MKNIKQFKAKIQVLARWRTWFSTNRLEKGCWYWIQTRERNCNASDTLFKVSGIPVLCFPYSRQTTQHNYNRKWLICVKTQIHDVEENKECHINIMFASHQLNNLKTLYSFFIVIWWMTEIEKSNWLFISTKTTIW